MMQTMMKCCCIFLWTELLRRPVERSRLCNRDRQYRWHYCGPTSSKSVSQ